MACRHSHHSGDWVGVCECMCATFLHVVPTQTVPLLSTAAGQLTVLKQWKVQPFQASSWSFFCQTSGCFECVWFFSPWLSFLLISHALHSTQPNQQCLSMKNGFLPVRIAMAMHSLPASSALLRICIKVAAVMGDGEVRRSAGREWEFAPHSASRGKASFHILKWYDV